MSRCDWERSAYRPLERGKRERNPETRRPAQDPAAAIRALQATIGNAAVARAMAGTRSLQRMKFERFEWLGPVTNWGSYSATEQALLNDEAALAGYIAGLEASVTADNEIQRLRAEFATLRQSTISATQYAATTATITRIDVELRARRALLKADADLAGYISKLENWATADTQIQRLLGDFRTSRPSTVPSSKTRAALTEIARIERELRERRAALLNENPSRRPGSDPIFTNKDPKALVAEIQQFLGRLELEKKQERERGVPVSSFRIVIPVPGEHGPTQAAIAESAFDEALEGALFKSITDARASLQEKLSYGKLNWTYSTDGLLSVGSTTESKHPVVGAGADVWAAGTVRLKITEAEDAFGSYKTALEKAEFYKARTAAEAEASPEDVEKVEKHKSDLENLRANVRHYENEAVTYKQKYEALGFKPEEDAAKIGKTVVIDFDSGHYQPSEAWRRAASAWQKLGYSVEFNPEGRRI